MQSKITFNEIRKAFSKAAIAVLALCLFSGLANAQTYINAPLSTGATSSNGTAAPAGFTWSEVQNPNVNAGFGANITAGLTIADDFIVPAGPSWGVTKVTFYAYSSGYAGATSPFNDVRLKIYNTDPSVGSPAAIFGDLTTNRFLASSSASMYRIFNATPGTTRQIWKVEATVSTTLAPGTYWIEWQLGNGGLSNFSPAATVVGVATQPGWNAKQNTLPNTWVALTDGGGPQDMPFQIDYTTGPCSGTPAPGNTIASTATVCPTNPVTLSLQNTTSGAGVTYQWQSGPSATGPWTNIAGATNSTYSTTTLAASTYFQAVVTCSGNSGTSTPVLVTLNPPSACYCIPGASDCTDDDVIENVTLGNMSKNSTCGNTTSGYSNYTSTDTATVIIGAANPIRVTTGDNWTEQVGVWIDYDRSGSFEASEFTNLGSTPAGSGGLHTANIIVPSNVATGYTRMRVRVRFSTALAGTNACLAYTFGETEDYTVNLVPCVPATITTQPTNKTISCEGNTTFTVALTGSLPSGYWEYRPSASGVWLNVPAAAPYSGVTTTTLTITTAPSSLNGYQFRFVYQGACTGVDFSSPVTLTVNPIVAAVTPASATICTGSVQQLTITNIAAPSTNTSSVASGPLTLTIPDQTPAGVTSVIPVSLPAGAQITGISVNLNVSHTWLGDLVFVLKAPNGAVFNLDWLLTGTGAGPTTAFVNTVISSTGTTALGAGTGTYTGTFAPDGAGPSANPAAGPTGFTPTVGTFAGLYSVPNGNWTLAMYDAFAGDQGTLNSWSINFTYLAGAPATGTWAGPAGTIFTDAAATVPYTGTAVNSVYVKPTALGVNNYAVTVATPNCTSAPLTIPITVRQLPTAISNVASQTICTGSSASFTGTTADGSVSGVQWQVSTDGGATFSNIANDANYSGATTNTLTVANAPASFNNNRYRLAASATPCAGPFTSNAATLTVNPTPVVVVSANPFTEIYPGQTTTLSAAVSPNAGATYTWFRNGVMVPGATGNTLVVDVDGLGEYTVNVTDVNGCSAASSASITISESANDIMFIYPSPNTGQFQVRYFSAAGNNPLPRTLNVYDSKGARVYSKSYTVNAPYTRLDVNIANYGKGVYSVELTDRTGTRLKAGRVVVL